MSPYSFFLLIFTSFAVVIIAARLESHFPYFNHIFSLQLNVILVLYSSWILCVFSFFISFTFRRQLSIVVFLIYYFPSVNNFCCCSILPLSPFDISVLVTLQFVTRQHSKWMNILFLSLFFLLFFLFWFGR